MATATTTTVVIAPAVAEVTEERIVLELTREEAETISAVFHRIGGYPKRADGSVSPRGLLTEKILPALTDALGGEYSFERSGEAGTEGARAFVGMYIPSNYSAVPNYRF